MEQLKDDVRNELVLLQEILSLPDINAVVKLLIAHFAFSKELPDELVSILQYESGLSQH